MCFCSVLPATTPPRLLQHTLLFFSPVIDKNLHWGRFIMECMTWFVLSLGWRPISLTSARQILFDKSLCQGMRNLSTGRYFVSWKQTHTCAHKTKISIYAHGVHGFSIHLFTSRSASFYGIQEQNLKIFSSLVLCIHRFPIWLLQNGKNPAYLHC